MQMFKQFAVSACLCAATLAQSATIDRMYTATFGYYTQTFTPGGQFMVFSAADYYQLSNGTTWDSGAGYHPDTYASLASVAVDGATITYTFSPPSSGLLFTNTDYNSGDHSAQGELGLPTTLAITATLGSTTGVMTGYTRVVSNTETWYGVPRFNYYTAPVGASVFFEQTFTLTTGSFTPGLFDSSFVYNESGYVDFTRTAPVPEPSMYVLLLLGLVGVMRAAKSNRERA